MEGVAFWVAAVVAAALVGMSKGGLPAVGMLGVPVLALVINPVTAAGLLLPVYVLSDLFGLYAYRHAFDRRVLAILVPGMVAGVVVGWATAALVPGWAVTALVGLIGFVFALNLLVRRKVAVVPRPARVGPGLFWGALTGFTSFVSHAGAPPYQVYTLPLGLTKVVFAGTSTIAFAILNAVKLVPYWQLGQLSPANLKVALVLMPVAAVAVFAGVRLVKLLPEAAFFRFVTWALLVLSVKLIWDGISGALM
ncbi:sulfite exporter TauE/SafE family protein [Pseudotabrizicola alkalilacus]|uniref:Probable membrane transporter protein n=1 Tax=Pseudotabrizicola alkalilacus TaxID=2305252 RepID=A0A411Z185_9RHOB|nr:sulfite exporter TauE/SafE family protein [Pseudotabrizicola alkalilacus]RGP36813.1 sulfite exporter TauE/SafE family protein [Pseudotabrizicola alkalilacus]